jgi:hypothetical protein
VQCCADALLQRRNKSCDVVQRPMLVDTNETITVRRLRMISIKRVIKGKDKRGRMSLTVKRLKGLKREKFPPL